MKYVEGEAPKTVFWASFAFVIGGFLGIALYVLHRRGPAKNEIGRDDVPADDVLQLVERNDQVKEQVVEYLRIRNREDLAQRGAERCKHCDALFVPVADKPWTLAGYCSRPCGLEQGEAPIVFHSNDAPSKRRTNIAAQCDHGHEFEVLASFAGCVRPCPTCGDKVRIGLQ